MHEHHAAGPDARPPFGDVVARRCVAVRAVDVHEVERPADLGRSLGRCETHVAHAIGDSGLAQVGHEGGVVRLALLRRALDLLGPPVVSGVRVDRDHRDAGRGRVREQDGRPAPVAADLRDLAGRLHFARALPEPLRLIGAEPALDTGDRVQRLLEPARRGRPGHGLTDRRHAPPPPPRDALRLRPVRPVRRRRPPRRRPRPPRRPPAGRSGARAAGAGQPPPPPRRA